MGVLICIILIVVIFVKDQKNMDREIAYRRTIRQLQEENKMLRELQQAAQRQETPQTEVQQAPIVQAQQSTVLPQQDVQKEVVKEARVQRKAIQKDVLKNNVILAVGSIFIVVAAISFLYTGWDVLHNALKISVLGILAGVFLLLSHLAKHKLNLPQTSKAFFYIAMGYIPIVLFSLSLLDLIGEYFSISGDGRFIYMFGMSALIMGLYYFVSYKLKDSKMLIAAHCMQTVVMIFGLFAIDLPGKYYGICFIIHALLFNLLIDWIKEYKILNKTFGLIQSLTYTVLAVSFIALVVDETLYLLILSILTMMLYYLLDMKFEKIPLKYVGHFLQSIVLLFGCQLINLDENLYPIILLIHSLVFNRFSKDYYGIGLFSVYALFSLSFSFACWGTIISPAIAMLMIINVLMLNTNNETEQIYKLTALKSFAYFFILALSFLSIKIGGETYSLPWIIREIIWTVIIGLTTFLYLKNPKLKFAKNGLVVNFICLTLMSFITTGAADILIPANVFTLLGFALVIATLKVVDIKEKSTLGISVLIYTLFRFLIESSVTAHIIYLIICALSLLLFESKKEFHLYRYIPLIAYFLKLYQDGFELFEEVLFIPTVLSILMLVALEFLSFVRIKNNEPFVIMSFFYMLLPFLWIEGNINEYIIPACISVWALVNLIVTIDKLRIVVKGALAFSLFMMYMMFVGDHATGLEVLLIHLGLITFMHYITRSLLGRRMTNYKIIEYIGLVLIYLTAMESITEPAEALLYLGMLTLFVIIAYKKKVGPLFLTTVIAMLVQLLDLTRDFWLAIPWWLYILGIGAVLVTFSMKNERNNQNSREDLKEKIKVAKEYLDM